MSSTTSLETAAVLAAARRERVEADAAECRLLERVLEWANLHQVEDPEQERIATYGDSPISLAGPGAPHVSHFAVLEFGAVIGMSRRSTENLFGEVIELGYRLPLTWARVTAGTLKAWRARHIAHATQSLSPEAAAFVDAQVAPYAHRVGPAELQRLIDTAIAAFMPRYAEEIAAQAEQSQFVRIDTDQPSYTGTCRLFGELDLADAQDLEQAIQAGAQQQKELGSELSLDARRAKALGNLARGEIVFDYNSGLPQPTSADPIKVPTVAQRHVMLYVHRSASGALAGTRGGRPVGSLTGRKGGVGGQSRRTARLKAWRGAANSLVRRAEVAATRHDPWRRWLWPTTPHSQPRTAHRSTTG